MKQRALDLAEILTSQGYVVVKQLAEAARMSELQVGRASEFALRDVSTSQGTP